MQRWQPVSQNSHRLRGRLTMDGMAQYVPLSNERKCRYWGLDYYHFCSLQNPRLLHYHLMIHPQIRGNQGLTRALLESLALILQMRQLWDRHLHFQFALLHPMTVCLFAQADLVALGIQGYWKSLDWNHGDLHPAINLINWPCEMIDIHKQKRRQKLAMTYCNELPYWKESRVTERKS